MQLKTWNGTRDGVKINIKQMQGNSFIHTRQDLRSQNELPEFSDLKWIQFALISFARLFDGSRDSLMFLLDSLMILLDYLSRWCWLENVLIRKVVAR